MPFVLDASISAAWAFKDEDHPAAAVALDLMLADTAIVPALWWFELRSALISNEKRKRTNPEATVQFLRNLRELSIEIDPLPNDASVFDLARKRELTFYDASYLELAKRRGIQLATLDRALIKAALAEGVQLIG